MAKKRFEEYKVMELFHGPPPFHPQPPQGGQGKGGASGSDALNEARQAQGKPPEGDGKAKTKTTEAGQGRAKKDKGSDPGKGKGGDSERWDMETIEERLARERDERRKRRR